MVHHTAQGLASLGRHGDSMLVHMSPHEVAGLQGLAMAQGGSLTINPDTGMPEAFNLGGFFKSLLPMAVGMMMPATAPMWAGVAAGAATGALTSKDPLMGAITGGFGGMGGMDLAKGLSATAGSGSTAAGITGSTGEMGSSLLKSSAGGYTPASVINGVSVPNVSDIAANMDKSMINTGLNQSPAMFTNPNMVNAANNTLAAGQSVGSGIGDFMTKQSEQLSTLGRGAKNLSGFGEPSAGAAWDTFKNAYVDPKTGTGALSDLQAMGKIGMPIGGAALGGLEASDLYGSPFNVDKLKDKYDPYASLNLSNDTGLRLLAGGGAIYDDSDNTTPANLSRDGFGVGRLNNLAGEQARTQAETYGYAGGGAIAFAEGGGAEAITGQDLALPEPAQGIAALPAAQPTEQGPSPEQMAAASAPPSTGGSVIEQVAFKIQQDPNYQPQNPIEAAIVKQLKGTDNMGQEQQGLGSLGPSQPIAPSYAPSVAMGPTYFAGMNTPKFGMARGGYLDGQGDGMSDSIPATIEGKQPARLADGEFVVPADVVSHIGNGSSKAGSKRLYKMLDKVRHARTGTKKQGREINPNKYLPA
jgi:hypothetical protein